MADAAQLVYTLLQMGALQRGEFHLKSGDVTGLHINFYNLMSEPSFYTELNAIVDQRFPDLFCDVSVLCASSDRALPLTTALSLGRNIPMVVCVTDGDADYTEATGARVEGRYKKGDRVTIITDVLATAISTKTTIRILESAGLQVSQCLTIVARDNETVARVECPTRVILYMDFIEYVLDDYKACRLQLYGNKQANLLYNTILWGRTNQILSCDKTSCEEIKEAIYYAIKKTGRKPLGLKIRSNIIQDITVEFCRWLDGLRCDLFLIDDLEISNPAIAVSQLHLTTLWADAVTVHPAHEPGTLDTLATTGVGLIVKRALTSTEVARYATVLTAAYETAENRKYLTMGPEDSNAAIKVIPI